MSTTVAENPNQDGPPPANCKRRIFAKVLALVGALIVALAALVAIQPSEFRVTRSATMAAPPAAVFAQVNDFHNWEAWSPWAKMDPNAKNSFEGSTSGTGSIFRWAGNSDVGEGSMTITESRPDELIAIRLDFIKPMAGTSTAEFTFKPVADNSTNVTWTMYGQNNFLAKAFHLVMDCDKMMGGWFEEGLANIKGMVESGNKS